jgi:hypothetical protein
MLMLVCLSDAVLPAASIQVPVTDWLVPSRVSVWLTVGVIGPDKLSAQSQVTVTSALFQPKELAAVRRANVIVGGVLSILKLMGWFA